MNSLRSRGKSRGARYRRYRPSLQYGAHDSARSRRHRRGPALDGDATSTPSPRPEIDAKAARHEMSLRGVLIKIVNSRLAARRVRLEEVVAVRLAQRVERARLDLADALARDAEHGADLLQGSRAPVVQAEAQSNHVTLSI